MSEPHDYKRTHSLPDFLPHWPKQLVEDRLAGKQHGDYDRWRAAVDDLPNIAACPWETEPDLAIDVSSLPAKQKSELADILLRLQPWRKGPFYVGDVHIDTEWRSDWKWQRIAEDVSPTGRVLDIGSGNGYFGWHMLKAGASEVVGIDPSLLFCLQHQAINHFIQSPDHWVLPLRIEEIPLQADFDSVFSMGVVYHRRDPQEHVDSMYQLCKPGGFALLESLIVHGAQNLIPESRYARMRNVWCVPTVTQMLAWLEEAGFEDVRTVYLAATTVEEQRSTPWMQFESLAQSLDPEDSSRTIEGYPAPVRAAVVGYRPDR